MVVAVFLSAATSFVTSIAPRPTKDPVRVWHISSPRSATGLQSSVCLSTRPSTNQRETDSPSPGSMKTATWQDRDTLSASRTQRKPVTARKIEQMMADPQHCVPEDSSLLSLASHFFCDQNHRILPRLGLVPTVGQHTHVRLGHASCTDLPGRLRTHVRSWWDEMR